MIILSKLVALVIAIPIWIIQFIVTFTVQVGKNLSFLLLGGRKVIDDKIFTRKEKPVEPAPEEESFGEKMERK